MKGICTVRGAWTAYTWREGSTGCFLVAKSCEKEYNVTKYFGKYHKPALRRYSPQSSTRCGTSSITAIAVAEKLSWKDKYARNVAGSLPSKAAKY